MKIASNMVTDAEMGRMHCETLIQTELGTYFIVDEDLLTGEATSRRISMEQAYEFQEIAKSQTAQEINFPEVR